MAIWLPGDSDFATAWREPNLLVPGKKPVGPVVAKKSLHWWMLGHDIYKGSNGNCQSRTPFATSPENFGDVVYTEPTPFGIANVFDDASGSLRWLNAFGEWARQQTFTLDINCYFNSGLVNSQIFNVDRRFELRIDAGGNLEVVIYDGSFKYINTTFNPSGKNVHIKLVREQGGNTTLYANNVLIGTVVTGSIIYTSGSRGATLGRDYNGANGIFGYLLGFSYRIESDYSFSTVYDYLTPANSTPYLFPVAGGVGATVTLNTATEADESLAVGKAKALATGMASQTDEAQAFIAVKSLSVAAATEADEAQAFTGAKTLDIGQALETDAALTITAVGEIVQAIDAALEADSAVAFGKAKTIALGFASESDEAQPIVFSGVTPVDFAAETDEAIAIVPSKRRAVTYAAETDEAQDITRTLAVALSAALETDSPIAFGKAKALALGVVTETETAQAIALYRDTTLNQADIDAIADAVYAKLVSEQLVLRLLELWQLQGLDIANPMTVTPTSREVDAIELVLSGDGINTTTVTRQ